MRKDSTKEYHVYEVLKCTKQYCTLFIDAYMLTALCSIIMTNIKLRECVFLGWKEEDGISTCMEVHSKLDFVLCFKLMDRRT